MLNMLPQSVMLNIVLPFLLAVTPQSLLRFGCFVAGQDVYIVGYMLPLCWPPPLVGVGATHARVVLARLSNFNVAMARIYSIGCCFAISVASSLNVNVTEVQLFLRSAQPQGI